jgi:hypothetical protein
VVTVLAGLLALTFVFYLLYGPPGALAQVLAARSSLLILAAPIGTALGARGTLLATISLSDDCV